MQHSLYYSIQIKREGLLPFLHGEKVGNDLVLQNSLLGNNSVLDPPDPIGMPHHPNSEVKRNCADDSVGSRDAGPPHVKVGHCQALN